MNQHHLALTRNEKEAMRKRDMHEYNELVLERYKLVDKMQC